MNSNAGCVLFISLVLAVTGCGTTEPPLAKQLEASLLGSVLYVNRVPFYPQTQYQCGPASLAAVLNYWGRDVTPDLIAQDIYRPQMKGTLSLDLWQYAKGQNLRATIEHGSWESLERHVSRNRPVIAFLNYGIQQVPVGHFLVVVGLDPDDRSVITYSGLNKDERIPFERFKAAWAKTNYWSLLIEPNESQDEAA
ncbi:MAG TPA: C39 family peptidase [Nitrospirales bacterium]|jgi:ABC-type bacteriocin/lantibiotic exporter with double-glycine peptidase domain